MSAPLYQAAGKRRTVSQSEASGAMTCNCEHDTHRAPSTQAEALELTTHYNAIAGQLERIAKADHKWMSVMRCSRCQALWAEDSMSSGHASLFYIYPIETDDPVAWLAAAVPLDPAP